ncbi:hypothetical protein AB0P37_08505 [Streptomyces antimycoticus]|uniref:hypothetical protein n=1 Tax=Streptomyces antimycoticus TaxID=68175 RepID=UPI0034493918
MPVQIVDIRQESAPALGDIRALEAGSWIYIFPNAKDRKDWPRYSAAIAHAVSRGASASWMGEHA